MRYAVESRPREPRSGRGKTLCSYYVWEEADAKRNQQQFGSSIVGVFDTEEEALAHCQRCVNTARAEGYLDGN